MTDRLSHSPEFSRRGFLQAAAIGSAAALAGAVNADDAAKPSRPRTNRGRIYKADKGGGIGKDKAAMVARLKEYKSLGYDGIEGGSPDVKVIPALLEAIKEVDFPVHGLVDGVHWNQRLSSPDEMVRQQGREALEQAIRDAHALRASTVLLVPGKVTGPDETHDDVWKRSIVEIRKALPVASRYGVPILIENVWNGFCENPEQLRDYIDEIDSPWVGVYFDIGNCRKFGPAEDWIRTLGSRIVKLDVKDWGKENSFCRLGEGDVDWPEVRKALAEINYSGWATREGKDNSLEDTASLMDELLDL
jgi:hexulose-6-phosphate isomerase